MSPVPVFTSIKWIAHLSLLTYLETGDIPHFGYKIGDPTHFFSNSLIGYKKGDLTHFLSIK